MYPIMLQATSTLSQSTCSASHRLLFLRPSYRPPSTAHSLYPLTPANSLALGFFLEIRIIFIFKSFHQLYIRTYTWTCTQTYSGKDSIKVLTICNTGSLATAGYGTALGVVRSLHAMGKLEHVYACETRPYNQVHRFNSTQLILIFIFMFIVRKIHQMAD